MRCLLALLLPTVEGTPAMGPEAGAATPPLADASATPVTTAARDTAVRTLVPRFAHLVADVIVFVAQASFEEWSASAEIGDGGEGLLHCTRVRVRAALGRRIIDFSILAGRKEGSGGRGGWGAGRSLKGRTKMVIPPGSVDSSPLSTTSPHERRRGGGSFAPIHFPAPLARTPAWLPLRPWPCRRRAFWRVQSRLPCCWSPAAVVVAPAVALRRPRAPVVPQATPSARPTRPSWSAACISAARLHCTTRPARPAAYCEGRWHAVLRR